MISLHCSERLPSPSLPPNRPCRLNCRLAGPNSPSLARPTRPIITSGRPSNQPTISISSFSVDRRMDRVCWFLHRGLRRVVREDCGDGSFSLIIRSIEILRFEFEVSYCTVSAIIISFLGFSRRHLESVLIVIAAREIERKLGVLFEFSFLKTKRRHARRKEKKTVSMVGYISYKRT